MDQTSMSYRLTQILSYLVDASDPVSANDLATALHVSSRTIFRELERAPLVLQSYGLTLETKSGVGLTLIGADSAKTSLRQHITNPSGKPLGQSGAQRRRLLFMECLRYQGTIKLSTLARALDVSEGTVSRDLDQMSSWFDRYHLTLLRKQGYGVEVSGSEEAVRRAIADVVHEQLDQKQKADDLDIMAYFTAQDSGILSLLDMDIVRQVVAVLRTSSTQIISRITLQSAIGLIIHLTVAIARVRHGDAITVDRSLLGDLRADPMYRTAGILATDIEDRFHIRFPEAEIAYILMHIQGARPRTVAALDQETNTEDKDSERFAAQLIRRFSNLTGTDFRLDTALSEGLVAHLRPTLNRLRYKLEIRNPLLEQIKTHYPETFDLARRSAEILELEERIPLSDDEIGYLTLHFGAALERYKIARRNASAITIGVVCASGIGISSLLASKMRSSLPEVDQIVPLSVEQVLQEKLNGISLLVTTLTLSNATIPTVFVNPLLTPEDLRTIRQAVEQLRLSHPDPGEKPPTFACNLALLDKVQVISIPLTVEKSQLLDQLVRQMVSDDLFYAVRTALDRREAMHPVWLAESRFVLYHAAVPGLPEAGVLMFVASNDDRHPDYLNTDIGAMMLIPDGADDVTRTTLSRVSEAVIDEPMLLQALRQADEQNVRNTLKKFMEDNPL